MTQPERLPNPTPREFAYLVVDRFLERSRQAQAEIAPLLKDFIATEVFIPERDWMAAMLSQPPRDLDLGRAEKILDESLTIVDQVKPIHYLAPTDIERIVEPGFTMVIRGKYDCPFPFGTGKYC